MEIAHEESVEEVSQDLRDLEGLTPELIGKLADGGVHTRDDLADLAVDELTDITGQSADEAKALIMKAREHWFTNERRESVIESSNGSRCTERRNYTTNVQYDRRRVCQ